MLRKQLEYLQSQRLNLGLRQLGEVYSLELPYRLFNLVRDRCLALFLPLRLSLLLPFGLIWVRGPGESLRYVSSRFGKPLHWA
jgi:hypothetical protein